MNPVRDRFYYVYVLQSLKIIIGIQVLRMIYASVSINIKKINLHIQKAEDLLS